MKIKAGILLLLSLLLLITACGDKEIAESEDRPDNNIENQLTLAIGGEPESGFDPTTGWGRYGSPLFQSTLLSRDQDLNITKDLATNYEVSADGLIWTVEIKSDVKFSDGEPLTADDIIFTFETAKQSQSVVDLTNLTEIEKISDKKIAFHLARPQSTFITTLQTLGIVPQHAYDQDYSEKPIGSGPYQLVEWRKGEQLIVKKNPYYYGGDLEFDRLTFLFAEEDQALAAAKAGKVDVLSLPITFATGEIPGMERVSLESVDNRGVMLPVTEPFTNEDGEEVGNEVTADPAIRRAMNMAVDREAMVEGILNGEGTTAYSSVDGLPWGNDQAVVDHNPAEAEQILKEAGWEKGTDGFYQRNGLKAAFTLYYPSGDQLRQSLSLVFADQMRNFGIMVETEAKSWVELEKLMHANPVMMGWGSHDPVELYSLYSSSMQGVEYFNSNYYKNEKIDEYLDKAIHALSEKEANENWRKIQWDGQTGVSAKGDAPWVWLVNLNHIYYVNEDINIGEQKVQPHGHGWPITDFITEWSIAE
ncbi:peptide/nickel transport system substrate-binding protein [Gracilibacillus ureilyticus]|uniref:Peptide/nickel transport system substrate-binding protein n=1 Tax=Gracilibacillus ureilyticus TaxID=531814 RepID=A0A1H9PI24_9BACI|nr:ABC transporter substrate-binding protein [Gracilibacillus ureilyticus]SER47946.1 peptide/nickel transport system substrate-binding protein [Gracilibacillus ureilyticus]